MKKFVLLFLFIYQINNLFSQSLTCLNATPFCATSINTFPASTGNGNAPVGSNYGCLVTQPNPAWFYCKIATPGKLSILISSSGTSGNDIDYICWGPFTSPTSACGLLDSLHIVSCSYSTSPSEIATIDSSQAGEYYFFMMTNYSNQPTNITFSVDTPSTATISCEEICTTNAFYNTPLCIDGTLQLLATDHFGLGTYTWSGSNGFSSSQINPTANNVSANSAGYYFVNYSLDSTCNTTDSILVSVDTCGMLMGRVYADLINNCTYDSSDIYIGNAQIKLSQNSNFVAWAWTDAYGYYFFDVPNGNYTIELIASPDYTITCPTSMIHSTTVSGPLITTENFAVTCNAFDIAAVGMVLFGQGFFPGLTVPVYPLVGVYTPECNQAFSIPGKVEIVLDTLLQYSSSSYSAPDTVIVTPTGDTLIWNVADINNIGNFGYFNYSFNIITNSIATIGDTVCFTIIIHPIQGDADTTNNILTRCFVVGNSYDPNSKEVYPRGDDIFGYISDTTSKLDYTVNFQNMGTASAQNIIVLDTLDADLDISTLKIISSSHQQTTTFLPGNVLKFNFSNIMLPDSAHSEALSHGYVKYSISPIQNLPPGTELTNKAYIYFDYNSPIVTNTAINTIEFPVSIHKFNNSYLEVWPNPTNNSIEINFENIRSESFYIKIINMSGQIIFQEKTSNNSGKYSKNIDFSNFSKGIYLLQIITNKETIQQKVVKY